MNTTWRYAVLFALLVTVPLWTVGGLWAWLNGYTYPEGLAVRLLMTWAFGFVVLAACIRWSIRRSH